MNKVNRIFMSLLGNHKKSRLPSGYTELEYITNQSTAYIDTGVILDHNSVYHIHVEKMIMPSINGWYAVFGCSRIYQSSVYRVYLAYDGVVGHNRLQPAYEKQFNGQGVVPPGTVISSYDAYIQDGSQQYTYNIGSDTYTHTATSTLSGLNTALSSFLLFTFNNNGNPVTPNVNHFKGSIGEFCITEESSNTVILDCVPAIEVSTNTVGMYDLVSNTFIASANSDSFVAGPIKQL